jgi:hypothetical protein
LWEAKFGCRRLAAILEHRRCENMNAAGSSLRHASASESKPFMSNAREVRGHICIPVGNEGRIQPLIQAAARA